MLNENNVTGLDFETARNNIYNLFENVKLCEKRLNTVFYYLFEKLSISWASEKAVQFGNTYYPKTEAMFNRFINKRLNICENAVRAYNIVARANGESTLPDNEYIEPGEYRDDSPRVDAFFVNNINGVTGMNIMLVKEYILPNFQTQIESDLAKSDNVPKEIKLFDSENSQKEAFSSSIQDFINELRMFIDEIKKEIINACETELDQITLAKQQATDTMNG